MTIDRAIELLQFQLSNPYYDSRLCLKDANKLGVQALQRILAGRNRGYTHCYYSLPGETKD